MLLVSEVVFYLAPRHTWLTLFGGICRLSLLGRSNFALVALSVAQFVAGLRRLGRLTKFLGFHCVWT